ncbi:unnamed protein product [Blepharisma stoltei]|uniref:Uncharacterized protein n=1 Tax=Blepharisma stoltei TaxID=1481888 RepID=A0AAU9IWD5_9CILI|nr:unnamed protein product [Blepharisma stoltei]
MKYINRNAVIKIAYIIMRTANAQLRHQMQDGQCHLCNLHDTKEHLLTEYTRYNHVRTELLMQLEKMGLDWRGIGLMQVLLYGEKYEEYIKKKLEEGKEVIVCRADWYHWNLLKERAWRYPNFCKYLQLGSKFESTPISIFSLAQLNGTFLRRISILLTTH